MKFKILTDNLTELETNWYGFWARVMLAKDFKEILPELTALAELGEDRAITIWYNLFHKGENVVIDDIVEKYPNMEMQDAAQSIVDSAFDLENAESEIKVKELLKNIEDSSLALVKSYQTYEPKVSTFKEFKTLFTLHFGFFINPEEEQNELDEILLKTECQLEDLVEHIGKLIKAKVKMKPEHKKLLKQIASLPCLKEVQNKLEESKNV